jgi:uncharacterized DUF497 family protein
MKIEWDAAKDQVNREKHGLSFGEAAALFTSGVDYLLIFDEAHSDDEDRFIAVGPIRRGVIVIVFTERDEDVVRIVSARKATRNERRRYRQHEETDRDR